MYILREYHERINGFICSRTRKAFIAAWVLLAAALALLGAVFLWIGAPPFNGAPPDTLNFVDGGWRILNGQTPHKDFYVFWGDLPLYVAWLGMKLGYPGVGAITCGNVCLMVAAGLAAMTVLRRRTSAFYACLFSLFLALLAVTPRPLGDYHDFTDYSKMYNRYGEAFLALLGTALFLKPEPALKKNWADWAEAGFAGFCLTLLLFCKLNYFAVGTVFFALACLLGRFTAKQAFFVLLSAAAFLKLALILTGIPFSTMWGDYRIMLGAQSFGERLPLLAKQIVKGILFLPVLWLLAWEISKNKNEPQPVWQHFLLLTAIFGGELCLVASNSQVGELPLLALAALYGAEIIRRQTRTMAGDGFFIVARNSGAALLVLFFLLPTLVTDLTTMRYCVRVIAQGHAFTSETLRSTRLNDLRIDSDGTRTPAGMSYMTIVDEGIQLLRRRASPQMRLTAFTWCDPLHVALGLPPPKGGLLCWSWTGITVRSHPPLKRLVGNATHILTGFSRGEFIDSGYGVGWDCRAPYGAEWDALHLEVVERTSFHALESAGRA
jgi:hypothetical protein